MRNNLKIKMLIDDLTSDIIKEYGIKIPITDINEIVKKMGGNIKEKQENEERESIVELFKDEFNIVICKTNNKFKKNFLCAKEIGNLFLKTDYLCKHENENISESEINYFALSILMPKDGYKKIMDINTKNGYVNTANLAKYFNVEESMAYCRGRDLGFLRFL